MDYEKLAQEFVRALRGPRSQTAFSRRLGYASNVLYSWESGRRWPAAAEVFRAAGRAGINVRAAFSRFYRTPPDWLAEVDMATPAGVSRFLAHERGHMPISVVAKRASRNRYSVSRWLSGKIDPRFPDFLRIVDATSLRLLDLLTAMVDPASLPCAAEAWLRLEAQRDLAFQSPYTAVVLRVLELTAYQRLDFHQPGWIARTLGITLDEEEECLNALARAGLIRLHKGRWISEEATVDTRRTPETARRLKSFWAELAINRLQAGSPGKFSYNVFSVSEADYRKLVALHEAYFRNLRSVVAESHPPERVILANVQLLPLDSGS